MTSRPRRWGRKEPDLIPYWSCWSDVTPPLPSGSPGSVPNDPWQSPKAQVSLRRGECRSGESNQSGITSKCSGTLGKAWPTGLRPDCSNHLNKSRLERWALLVSEASLKSHSWKPIGSHLVAPPQISEHPGGGSAALFASQFDLLACSRTALCKQSVVSTSHQVG